MDAINPQRAVKLWTLLRKAGVAVLDEGLFAGANFLVSVLLARWLSQTEFGAFSAAQALFLLLTAVFYTALCAQPILVFGAREYAERFRAYLGAVLGLHVAVMLAQGVALLLVAWGAQRIGSQAEAVEALVALALAGPFITLLWLARRAHYARLEPHWSLYAGALYTVLMGLGLYALEHFKQLSTASAFALMALASLASALLLLGLLRPQRWQPGVAPTPRSIVKPHWQYGKWSALTSALRWSMNSAYYLMLPLYLGLAAGAVLRANMNLLLPFLHANAALGGLLVPYFVKLYARTQRAQVVRALLLVLAMYGAAALVFWALLLAFAEPIMRLLYAQRYQADIKLLAIVGLLPLTSGIAGVLESALVAAGKPRAAAICYVVSALVTFTLGWWLLKTQGVHGAGVGLLAASAATCVALAWTLARVIKTGDWRAGAGALARAAE